MNHLPLEVPENALLVSFDVQSLYSNIPHKLGIEAITYWLTKFSDDSPIRFPKEFILEGINFILNNKTFHFNGNYFRQTKGTAMGTKFAPVYATLVMGYLEETLYEKIKNPFRSRIWEGIYSKLEEIPRRLLCPLDKVEVGTTRTKRYIK